MNRCGAGIVGDAYGVEPPVLKRGADVIEILTMPFDGSPMAQAAMVALGKAIYPRF